MRILFIHQNCPGQYKYLAPHMAAKSGNKAVFITQPGKPTPAGVAKVEYKPSRQAGPNTHRYIRNLEGFILNGQGVARAAIHLKKAGFAPDIVCAHPSWGESLFVKDVFPDARLLLFCEFYYRAIGADVGFDPAYPVELDDLCRVRVKNAAHMLALEAMDWGVSPTEWQRRQYPSWWQQRISLIHDGIDTDVAKPDAAASYTLPDGTVVRAGDEVVTYVARNLEPYRGFPSYMRALEDLCRRRPNARFIVVGGDDVSYGQRLPKGETYRQKYLKEVKIDPARVYFIGQVPYDQFVRVLQVSAAHVYLTYPFVLSWSMLESMAAGCLLIGSDTAPVRELIRDGENGLLVDFFSPKAISDRVEAALKAPEKYKAMRERARATVLERYNLADCLARHVRLIEDVAARRFPPRESAAETARAQGKASEGASRPA
jgi:glycosyltransferase involved in cell wall biosynthesis